MNAKKRARQERAVERFAKSIAISDNVMDKENEELLSFSGGDKELAEKIRQSAIRAKSCAEASMKNTLRNLGREP